MLDSLLRQALFLLQPTGFTWACLLFLAAWGLRRRQWVSGLGALALAVMLYVFGSTDLPGSLLRRLEGPWVGVDAGALPAGDAVVVLGGGAEPSRFETGKIHFSGAGDRILRGVEVMRLGKAPALVIGGGGGRLDADGSFEADLVRQWVLDWQLLPANTTVQSLGACTDTHDEAVKVRALADNAGWKRILLVTSASHMRRALATFRTQGLDVIPVPCNFLTTLSTTPSGSGFSVPRHETFGTFRVWLHEHIGWLEYRRRGWIAPAPKTPVVGTFSIVARDPRTGELGVAVQSRVVAVGAIVPWAKAGVGAVATQAYANPHYGPRGLELLAAGQSCAEVLRTMTGADKGRAERQAGIVDAAGKSGTFTGGECLDWAGGRHGENYAVQGNILAGEEVIAAMEESFLATKGELGQRLLEALAAGQAAGGDRRGMQSAALLLVRQGWGYAGLTDRYRDLRVDDHPTPIVELQRLYSLHRRTFPPPSEREP